MDEKEFPEEEMQIYIGMAQKMGISPDDFEAKRFRKDISCPYCKQELFFRVFTTTDSCKIVKAKYQIRCKNCNQVFETDWRGLKTVKEKEKV